MGRLRNLPIMVPSLLGQRGAGARTYATILQEDYGADEVWPLVDIASGTTIHAHVNGNRDGTIGGIGASPHWDLQNAAGPVSGTLAPYSDGANDYGDMYSSNGNDGLADIFDGNEGSFFIFYKPDAAALTDGLAHTVLRFVQSGANYFRIRKTATDNQFEFRRVANGVSKQVFPGHSSSEWASMGMSWSVSGDEQRAFINGSQVGATLTGLDTFGGVLSSNETLIGAATKTPSEVWLGHLAYFAIKIGGIWTPTQFQGMDDAVSEAAPDP